MSGSDRGHEVTFVTLDTGLKNHRSSDVGLVLRGTQTWHLGHADQSWRRSAALTQGWRPDDIGTGGHRGPGWHMD